MEVFKAIQSRRSVRFFKGEDIPFTIISKLLESLRWGPTPGNLHPIKAVVVDEAKMLQKVANACIDQEWVRNVPVMVVICSDTEKVVREFGELGKKYALQSTAAATQNLLLAAEEVGIASCWIGAFSDSEVRKQLKIPQEIEIHNLVALGYPAKKVKVPMKPFPSFILKKNSWENLFEQKFKGDYQDIPTVAKKAVRAVKQKYKKKKAEKSRRKTAKKVTKTTRGR